MADYGHAELISASHNFEPSPCPLPQGAEGKEGSIENMPPK